MLVNAHYLPIKIISLLFFTTGIAETATAQLWTLERCIDTAQVHNKNLQIGRNNIQINDEKKQEASAHFLPKVNFTADYRYYLNLPYQFMPMSVFNGPEGAYKEAQFGVPHNINAQLQLAIPLYNPKIRGGIRNTGIASQLTELQYQKTAERIYFDIINLYYNAQVLLNQLTFIDSNLVNARRLLKNTQLLKAHLMARTTDVNKVALQTDQLATQRETVNARYMQILNTLKLNMGIPIEQNIDIEKFIAYPSAKDYTSTPVVDIKMAQTQQLLIENEIKNLRALRLPTLSLYGSYGTTGFGYDKAPNDFLKFKPVGFAGVRFAYPLFDGTISKRKIIQKKLELKNNELQLSLLYEQNNMQIGNARQQRLISNKSVATHLKQLQLAESIYEQTFLQQKQGIATLTDVLLADNDLRETQQSYLSAVIDFLKADLELKMLTGNILNQ